MVYEFEIVKVIYHHNRGQFIFGRLLNGEQTIEIQDGALLGEIPVYQYHGINAADENNQPFYVLRPLEEWTLKKFFQEKQKVALVQ